MFFGNWKWDGRASRTKMTKGIKYLCTERIQRRILEGSIMNISALLSWSFTALIFVSSEPIMVFKPEENPGNFSVTEIELPYVNSTEIGYFK